MLTQGTLRNSVTHFAAAGFNVVSGLVLVPAIIAGIGPAQFGIWAIANTLIGYSGLLDLGLGQTLVKKTSELLAAADERGLEETIGTIFSLYAALSLASMSAFVLLSIGGSVLFQIPQDLFPEFATVVLILGAVTSLGLPMSVLSGVIGGMQAFYVTNTISIALGAVRLVATLALLANGFGLVSLVVLAAASSVAGWIASFAWLKGRMPGFRMRLRRPDRSRLHETISFSGSMFIWSIAGQALQTIDRLVMGATFPIRFTGIYEVGARINSFSRVALNVVFIAMPTTSALFAQGRIDRLAALYFEGTKLVMGAYGLIAVGMLALGADFVRLWIGPGYEQAVVVAQILVIASFYQSQNSLGHVMLAGLGRLRVFTRVMAMYPPLLITCCVLLGAAIGMEGVAGGVLLSIGVLETILSFHLASVMSIAPRKMWLGVYSRILLCMAASFVFMEGFRSWVTYGGWPGLIVNVSTLTAVYGLTFLLVCTNRDERLAVRKRMASAWK